MAGGTPFSTPRAILIGYMFFQAPDPDEAERFLAENGLDAIEISLPINADRIRDSEKKRIIACGRRLPGCVALHDVIPLALAHRQLEFRRKLIDRLIEDVLVAREAGIRIITLHTSCTRTKRSLERDWRVGSTKWLARALDRDVTPDYEESVRIMADALRELAPYCTSQTADGQARNNSRSQNPNAKIEVALAVENNFRDTRFFGRRIDSVNDVLDVLDRANAPAAQMCFDVFKAFSTEKSIPESIARAGSRIVNVHASDAEPAETAFFRRRAAVGKGLIDWTAVMSALRTIHYTGPVDFEMMHSVGDVAESARRLREILAEIG